MAAMLRERFGLVHATLQVDHSVSQLLEIAPPRRRLNRAESSGALSAGAHEHLVDAHVRRLADRVEHSARDVLGR